MEIDSENVAEIEKYAFLLGSAIKNEDTEQFFSIYDSILPRDIPDNQLEEIKDRARQVADLSDEKFNDLVSQARHFSLAPAGTAMTCRRESPKQKLTQPNKLEDSEEDDGVGSWTYSHASGGKSDTSSFYSSTKISTKSSEYDSKKFDEDSGVCNSSKATNSIGSWSDHEGSEDEGHGVSYDYYPPQIKIRSGCGLSLDYDEAHEVKSDRSSQDVNSPRSDISEGIEMITFKDRKMPADDDDDNEFNFRREVKYQDDFNTSGDSEDEHTCTSHRDKYYNMGYRPLTRDTLTYNPKFESRHSWDSDLSTSSLRNTDVDRGISFSSLKEGTSQYSRYSSYQYPNTSTSDNVRIQSNMYKREKKGPPFGRGPEQFDNVANSIGSLITSAGSSEVKNMPEGRKLELLQGTREDSKKKKKKKKNPKDDASAATDENGNPVVDNRSLNPVAYKQMRESPTVGTVANSHYDSGYGTFPPTDHPRPYSSRDTENDPASKLSRRKKKLEKQGPQKKAEDVENYKGDRPLEEIISFIAGQNESNKKTKKTSPVPEDIPNRTQKSNKKNKDKKQKSPTASSAVTEAAEKGSNSAQTAFLDLQDNLEMGNSSVKTEVEIPVHNGDIDGMYRKKGQITKPVLKENDLSKTAVNMSNDGALNNMICRESVKEKEPSVTNNKRDNLVCGTGIESNKKKPDKPNKSFKAEKSEMTVLKSEEMMKVSKSEEMMKLESSLPNSMTVKQKNSKNKKNKPTSPVVKTEGDSFSVELNQPELAGFPKDETLADDTFMFTDLDMPQVPKEDEFQLVGKKKKKLVKEVSHQNHFVSNGGNNHKPVRRQEDKRQLSLYSSNKATVPNAPTVPDPESDTRIRDLSPSAFPALTTGKGRQSQEGRRNSTGDVQIPSGLKSQDDSDLESVKSLPVTQSTQIDCILSPRLSYARMAAGSKPPDSSDLSDKRSSVDSGGSDHDHKKSVWKGSPTERRHSIGSSPELLNKATGSPASVTASVKAGSQDHIVADVVVNIEKEKLHPVLGVGKKVEQNVERNEDKVVTSVLNNSPSEKSVHAKVSLVCQTSVSQSGVESVLNNFSAPQQQSSKQHIAYSSEFEMNSSSSMNRNLTSVSNSSMLKNEKSKVKQNNTSNGNKKQKSVIFLDKRVDERMENLGISFGFEIDNVVKIGKTESIPKSAQADNSEQKLPKFNDMPDADANTVDIGEPKLPDINNLSSTTSSSHSVISNSNSSSEVYKSSSADRTDQVKVIPAQLVRLNGVIHPQGHKSDSSTEVNEEVSIKFAGGGESVNTQSTIPDLGLNGVYVYFGESVVTLNKEVVVPSLTNGPTSYCGKIQYVEEDNLHSNFNLAEAAAFLTREWDRTLQLQDKGPGEVYFHQE